MPRWIQSTIRWGSISTFRRRSSSPIRPSMPATRGMPKTMYRTSMKRELPYEVPRDAARTRCLSSIDPASVARRSAVREVEARRRFEKLRFLVFSVAGHRFGSREQTHASNHNPKRQRGIKSTKKPAILRIIHPRHAASAPSKSRNKGSRSLLDDVWLRCSLADASGCENTVGECEFRS